MDEFELIHRFFSRRPGDANVIVGVGDDGAVLRPAAGRDLISVVDSCVADVHFPANMTAGDVGYRAVAVNLSDLAAMGARPRWMLLSLTLPETDADWLAKFAGGLFEAADEYAVDLVGGDTTRGDTLVVTVHLLGDADPEKVIIRAGASPGDQLWLSGSTGDAAAGLRLLQDTGAQNVDATYLKRRFCRPLARVDLGQAIAGIATAAIDLSDGLYADVQKLVESSNAGAALELDAVPQSAELCHAFPDDALTLAMAGGDDYELCFTAPPARAGEVARAGRECGVPVTPIGEITAASGIVCRMNGEITPFEDPGYRHF